MHPAPSVIVFTVLSGIGFGFLAALGFGVILPAGWAAFWLWGLGYALAVAGLLASTLHLGNPQRALLAFTQWRSSWLSREGWAAVATLLLLAPVAALAVFGDGGLRPLGWLGGALAIATVFATSMIYTQLKSVPRWNHWMTPVLFLLFAATGAAILVGAGAEAILLGLVLSAALAFGFLRGDRRFAEAGATLGSATRLGAIGEVRSFAPPHTGSNYLMREMIHVVGRKHALKLRLIAVALAGIVPALVLLVLPAGPVTLALAAALHLAGAFAARWLFFAEAEHVVGLYYGRR